MCENIQRVDTPQKSLLKDICIHHYGELLQNAPNKTCINPALRNMEIKRILDQRYYMSEVTKPAHHSYRTHTAQLVHAAQWRLGTAKRNK